MKPSPSQPTVNHAEGVRLQPMLHVQDMEEAVRFFETLGGSQVYGSRDGDWTLLRFGNTEMSLLRHPPNRLEGDSEFELNFISSVPLEQLESKARRAGLAVVRSAGDEAFGKQMILELSSGMRVKVNQIEEDLVR